MPGSPSCRGRAERAVRDAALTCGVVDSESSGTQRKPRVGL